MIQPTISAIIIDDEIKGRETLKSLLEEFCDQVVVLETFSTIKAGVDGVKTLNPDVVFLDISLPVEDGFQFFKYFEKPAFEVVFVTAYTAYLEKASTYAALDYLMKPVYIEDLKRIVEELKSRKAKTGLVSSIGNEHLKTRKTSLVIPGTGGLIFLSLKDLILCRVEASDLVLYAEGYTEGLSINRTYDQFRTLVQGSGFLEPNEELLVNPDHVLEIERSDPPTLILSNRIEISVDPSFLESMEVKG